MCALCEEAMNAETLKEVKNSEYHKTRNFGFPDCGLCKKKIEHTHIVKRREYGGWPI